MVALSLDPDNMDEPPEYSATTPTDLLSLHDDGLLRAIFASCSDAMFIIDKDERIFSWNPSAERLYGWRADEIIGRYAKNVILLPTDNISVLEFLQTIDITTPCLSAERTDKWGNVHQVDSLYYPLHDDIGHFAGYAVLDRDNSETTQLRMRLKREIKAYRTTIDMLPYGVILHDYVTVRHANVAAAELLGFDTPSQMVGTNLCILLGESAHEREQFITLLQQFAKEQKPVCRSEVNVRCIGGSLRQVMTCSTLCQDDDGDVICTMLCDVTQCDTESSTDYDEKLAFTERLIENINTPLTVIYAEIQRLQSRVMNTATGVEQIDELAVTYERMVSNIKRLREVVRSACSAYVKDSSAS